MRHRGFHEFELLAEQRLFLGRQIDGGVAQHRERRLEAVRQIPHRLAVTLLVVALAHHETVQGVGEGREFAGVIGADVIADAGAQRGNPRRHAAHRRQPPAQRHQLRHDEQQRGTRQADGHVAAKGGDLRPEGAPIGEHPEGHLRLLRLFPDHGVAELEHIGVLVASRVLEPKAAGRRPRRRWRRQRRDPQRWRAPCNGAVRGLDVGVKARIGRGEAWVSQVLREVQAIAPHLRGAQQPVNRAAHLLLGAGEHAGHEGALQHPPRGREERAQGDGGRHHQPPLEAAAAGAAAAGGASPVQAPAANR